MVDQICRLENTIFCLILIQKFKYSPKDTRFLLHSVLRTSSEDNSLFIVNEHLWLYLNPCTSVHGQKAPHMKRDFIADLLLKVHSLRKRI